MGHRGTSWDILIYGHQIHLLITSVKSHWFMKPNPSKIESNPVNSWTLFKSGKPPLNSTHPLKSMKSHSIPFIKSIQTAWQIHSNPLKLPEKPSIFAYDRLFMMKYPFKMVISCCSKLPKRHLQRSSKMHRFAGRRRRSRSPSPATGFIGIRGENHQFEWLVHL